MKFHKAFYSLIQYCPDPARVEAANIGVLLFCPDLGFLQALTAKDNRRVQRFFGSEGQDWQQLNLFKIAFRQRIDQEQARITSVEKLQEFVDQRANLIRVTDPQPMRVGEPADDLRKLFDSLVGGQVDRETPRPRFQTVIARRFEKAQLDNKLRKDIPVSVPYLKKPITFPFGFQNGTFNLLQPVSFTAEDPDDSVRKAFQFAGEADAISSHPDPELGVMKLVVIARFRSKTDEARGSVADCLRSHDVQLVAEEQLNELVQEIKAHGKEFSMRATVT